MEYSFKPLTSADLGAMKSMLLMFGEAFNDLHTYQDAVPSDEYLNRLLAKPDFIALAAFEGEDVVGGLCAYVFEKFEQERKEIYIYDLAVDEAHRRKGIATRLINELRAVGKKIGAYVIIVQADKGEEDQPAIKLYESLGTKEDVFNFDISVE